MSKTETSKSETIKSETMRNLRATLIGRVTSDRMAKTMGVKADRIRKDDWIGNAKRLVS